MRKFSFVLVALSVPFSVAVAQSANITIYHSDDPRPQRSFVLAKGSDILSANGDWRGIAPLTAYAKAHPGSYILFEQNGAFYRIDSPQQVGEAERLYQPLQELGAQQHALAAKQRPLAEQQAALGQQQAAAGQQMRGATPAEMSSLGRTQSAIGHEQGIIGHAQGDIGREQGVIGRQQGVAGKRFYDGVQSMIDDCLAKHTCAAVREDGK